ncbi:MAG: hypothetical protein H0X66_13210 [Verrucomicrobia bacterium]|nr:hypothetical protein [Verrucomicrobiota bacterium]
MNLSLKTRKIVQLTTIAAACFLGATQVSAQTLLLRYTFDESASSSVDAVDTGATPAANGVFTGADRVATTPGGFSTGAMNSTGAAAPDSLKYVIASDENGEVDKLDGLTSFTLTAWINVQELPNGNRRILAKQAGSTDGFSWNFSDSAATGRSAGNFGTRLFIGGTEGFAFDGVNNTIDADNKWVFIAVTYDGTDGGAAVNNVKYYVGDTTATATNQSTTTITGGTTNPSDVPFGVGYTGAAPTALLNFPGWVDDARVYSGVLDAAALDVVRLENLPSSGPTAVLITNPNRSGTTVTFSFESETGRTHTPEYKNTLDDVAWVTLTPIVGDGTTKVVTDAAAVPATRFYRVVTQ